MRSAAQTSPDGIEREAAEFGWGSGLGLAGSVGGGIWWLIQGVSPKRNAATAMWSTIGSGATFVGGLALLGASGRIHPISAARAMELADKHNRKLKKELELPADYSPLPGVASPSDVHFRVAIQPDAAGATLQILF